MLTGSLITLMHSISSIFSWARQQSKPDVPPELREQTINIIDDLVDDIAPDYLLPNPIFRLDYKMAIYERVYRFLLDELGERRFEKVYYRDEIFDLLRDISSERFFNATEYLLKEMYRIVHIQRTIPDNIIPNPHAGNQKWSRKESVRDRHIKRFKGTVDLLNHRLFQNNAKCRYDLGSGFVQMVNLDPGSDVPEEDSGIQKQDNNQPSEHHQDQSRSESWNRKHYIIAVVILVLTALGVIFAALVFFFGDGILSPLLH